MERIAIGMIQTAIAVSTLITAGCAIDVETSRHRQTENRSIDLDKSEMVTVHLRMGAGELNVRGGSTKLLNADFNYDLDRLRPEVRYDASAFHGHLSVEEPSHTKHVSVSRNRWELRFNDEKPLDMEVEFGAGQGHLDLGTLTLRSLDVQMGVGELRIDLRGTPKNDYSVKVRGGVGEVTIYLPDGVGIEADANGGIGGINARGLHKRDGRYTNEAYGHSKVNVRLDITGGIGAINLVGG